MKTNLFLFTSLILFSISISEVNAQWKALSGTTTITYDNGNVGIGTGNRQLTSKFVVSDGMGAISINEGSIGFNRSVTDGLIYNPTVAAWQFTARDERFTLEGYNGAVHPLMAFLKNGNVGIGTISPASRLTVAGDIHAREIKVATNAGADFVFDEHYPLRSLSEVEQFISQNKHLPGIAPADSMVQNGVNMGDMQIKLLQKIEELTLYMIEQEKKIEKQQARNEKLEKQLESQQDEIDLLKKENR